MKIFTIGFTQKSAKTFFELLKDAKVKSLLDTRLNNTSQLSGFAKSLDLDYFTRELCHIPYRHLDLLAPSKEILEEYKKKTFNWDDYQGKYLHLLEARRIAEILTPDDLDGACFLCSEAEPHHCHRRLAAEFLKERWGNIDIIHL